jgi:hypothetical protein
MLRHLVIGAIEIRLVTAGPVDAGPGIIGHDQLGGSVEVLEGCHVASDPVRQVLTHGGLCKGISTGAQHGHEQRRRRNGTTVVIVDGDSGAGPIHEHFFTGAMLLAHHHVLIALPALIQLAKTAVAVAVGLSLAIFFPEQLQGHVLVTF